MTYGYLVGERDLSLVYAALPVGHVKNINFQEEMFRDLTAVLSCGEKLVETRRLGIVGVYCSGVAAGKVNWQKLPPTLIDPLIFECPLEGKSELLWLQCHGDMPTLPFIVRNLKITRHRLDPRRIQAEWIKSLDKAKFGYMAGMSTFVLDRQRKLTQWAQGDRIPAPDELCYLSSALLYEAIQGKTPIQIRYWAGSQPGKVRIILPKQCFRVKDYEPVYLLATDEQTAEERTYRIEFIEACPKSASILGGVVDAFNERHGQDSKWLTEAMLKKNPVGQIGKDGWFCYYSFFQEEGSFVLACYYGHRMINSQYEEYDEAGTLQYSWAACECTINGAYSADTMARWEEVKRRASRAGFRADMRP